MVELPGLSPSNPSKKPLHYPDPRNNSPVEYINERTAGSFRLTEVEEIPFWFALWRDVRAAIFIVEMHCIPGSLKKKYLLWKYK